MFIFHSHFILKTCGETTLLHAVQPMLELARQYGEFDVVDVRTFKYFKTLLFDFL
jgi:hypothetical protein